MDSCNEDMMSSIPPISTGHARSESAPELFIKGVPENVVSMASGRMISDATFSGEMCDVWRHLVREYAKALSRSFNFIFNTFFCSDSESESEALPVESSWKCNGEWESELT